MSFLRARTKEQVAQRKKQILEAAARLYDLGGYAEVNFSKISELTSLTRPAIYSYFKTPDDILLSVLGRDFELLNEALERQLTEHTSLSGDDFAVLLFENLKDQQRMLKMLSLNYSLIELQSTLSCLVEFKRHIMRTFRLISAYLEKFFPQLKEKERTNFGFILFSYLSSVYTLTNPSDKQLKAIALNDASFTVPNFTALFLTGLKVICQALNK